MRNFLIILLFISIGLCSVSCSVKDEYDLSKDIDYTVSVGSQFQVPIGSFGTIHIGKILSKQAKEYFSVKEDGDYLFDPKGESLTNFKLGNYEIHGLGFVSLFDYSFPTIKFTFKLKNSLPFKFILSSHVLDSQHNPIDSFISSVDATIPPGSVDNPSTTELTLEIRSKIERDGFGFDGFSLVLEVERMPSSTLEIDSKTGISIKNVVLQLPDGVRFKINKVFDNF